ncbi:hypothetical protein Dimus_025766, partial [Dionaea muscipula]
TKVCRKPIGIHQRQPEGHRLQTRQWRAKGKGVSEAREVGKSDVEAAKGVLGRLVVGRGAMAEQLSEGMNQAPLAEGWKEVKGKGCGSPSFKRPVGGGDKIDLPSRYHLLDSPELVDSDEITAAISQQLGEIIVPLVSRAHDSRGVE